MNWPVVKRLVEEPFHGAEWVMEENVGGGAQALTAQSSGQWREVTP